MDALNGKAVVVTNAGTALGRALPIRAAAAGAGVTANRLAPGAAAQIDAGAHVYVCGDATGMGPAVEEALGRIGATISDDQDGDGWLREMRAAGRYATDVY
ncbi:hypothetical protein ACIBO2_09495 [Nonomuraea sp. NPDC050022]|uniref:hypothetical protein n=1 Tax=unclassified Nonomuraea TaxID=2593643 RepID=UPI003407AED6